MDQVKFDKIEQEAQETEGESDSGLILAELRKITKVLETLCGEVYDVKEYIRVAHSENIHHRW